MAERYLQIGPAGPKANSVVALQASEGGGRLREMTTIGLSDEPSLHLETLRQITLQMTVARDVSEVLDAITTALVTTAGAALARIWLRRSAAECPICRAHNWQQPPMKSD